MAVVDMYCNHDFEVPSMDQAIADAAFPKAEKLLQVCHKTILECDSPLLWRKISTEIFSSPAW